MIESLILSDLTVESRDTDYVLTVKVKDTDSNEETEHAVSIGKTTPIAHTEEVFKLFAHHMFKIQFGDTDPMQGTKLPNREEN